MDSIACNFCGQDNTDRLFQLPDWQSGQKELRATLVKCRNCGLIYQNPRPSAGELAALYPENYECYQPEMEPDHLPWISRVGASYGMKKRASLVLAEKKGGRLLDVGCATGVFLKEMSRYPNWELYGVELSKNAARIAQQKTSRPIFQGTVEEAHYEDGYFDVITLWDVLEHLYDPMLSIQELSRILKPGGILIARVPNASSWDARFFGKYWAGYEPPRHLYVFEAQAIKRLVEKNGLEINEIGCNFGGYLTFLLSLQFVLSDTRISRNAQRIITKVLQFPLLRLIVAPLFWWLSRNLHGPLINFSAVKRE